MESFYKTKWHGREEAPVGVAFIDFTALQSSLVEREKLKGALESSSVFYLENFGVEAGFFDAFLETTDQFFKSPESERNKMACPELPPRGYTALKSEKLSEFLGVGHYADLCMKYSWSRKGNIYPNEAFRELWADYYQHMQRVAASLLTTIGEIWPIPKNCNKEDWNYIVEGDGTLRSLYYPDLTEAQSLSMAPHSDLGTVSLLYQTPAPNGHVALEVEVDGAFVGIPAVAGTVVVNFGDTLAHVTGNEIKAVKHRVTHSQTSGGQRTSTIYFALPHRNLNLKKFSGSNYHGSLTEDITTFGELIDSDGKEYLHKKVQSR